LVEESLQLLVVSGLAARGWRGGRLSTNVLQQPVKTIQSTLLEQKLRRSAVILRWDSLSDY
jgi:hypothetical protein